MAILRGFCCLLFLYERKHKTIGSRNLHCSSCNLLKPSSPREVPFFRFISSPPQCSLHIERLVTGWRSSLEAYSCCSIGYFFSSSPVCPEINSRCTYTVSFLPSYCFIMLLFLKECILMSVTALHSKVSFVLGSKLNTVWRHILTWLVKRCNWLFW